MSTHVNLSNLWARSWDCDHLIKKNHEVKFSIKLISNDEIKKKNSKRTQSKKIAIKKNEDRI